MKKEHAVVPPFRAPHSMCTITILWGVVIWADMLDSDSAAHSTYPVGGHPC